MRRIPYAKHEISDADVEAVVQSLRSDCVTQGPRVGWFEDGLREATGASYAVAVSSGTAALRIACQALDIGPGDCGIVPAITFAATANCLRQVGAAVRFADACPDSGLADGERFEAALEQADAAGQRVKALLPVTFTGRSIGLERIGDLAGARGAFVIEDAAHSLGGAWIDAEGRHIVSGSCACSDAATLSFHPAKHVCAGEGGAVLTNDPVLARRARRLRTHGIEKRPEGEATTGGWFYEQVELGDNCRMTELQAALGASQLGRLSAFVERRLKLAERYHRAFGVSRFAEAFARPELDPLSAWHLYVIRFADPQIRRRAYDFLRERGVYTQVHYIPVYRHPYYQAEGHAPLPGAERFYDHCLTLPLYSSLSDDDQDYVIDSLGLFCESIRR